MPSLEVARHCFSLRWGSKPRRLAAASALRKLAAASAVPALARALRDPEPEVRKRVVTALMYIGNDRVVESLLFASDDPDGEVRHSAVAALHAYRGPHVLAALRERLRDPELPIRYEAVRVLGLHRASLSDARTLAVIEEAVERGDAEWVGRFFAMLQESGEPDAERRLVDWLRHRRDEVRRAAAKALDEGGWEGENEQDCIAYAIAQGDYQEAARFGEAAVDALADALVGWNPGAPRSVRGEKESRVQKEEGLAMLASALESLQPLPARALEKLREAATAGEPGRKERDEAIARLLAGAPPSPSPLPASGRVAPRLDEENEPSAAFAGGASAETEAEFRSESSREAVRDGELEPEIESQFARPTRDAAEASTDGAANGSGWGEPPPGADESEMDESEMDEVEAGLFDWVQVELDEDDPIIVQIDDEPRSLAVSSVETDSRARLVEAPIEPAPDSPARPLEDLAAPELVPPTLGYDEGAVRSEQADDADAEGSDDGASWPAAAQETDASPEAVREGALAESPSESEPESESPPKAFSLVEHDVNSEIESDFEASSDGESDSDRALSVVMDGSATGRANAAPEPSDFREERAERLASPSAEGSARRGVRSDSAPELPPTDRPTPWEEAPVRAARSGRIDAPALREAAARRERRLARTPLAWRELTIMASSADVRMRLAVVDRLRVVSGDRATRRIAQMLNDRDVQVRALALTVLCKRRAAGWERYVSGALFDEYPQMRSAAVRTLASWKTSPALEALADYLTSQDRSQDTALEVAAKLAPFVPPAAGRESAADGLAATHAGPVGVASLGLEALFRLQESDDPSGRAREEIARRLEKLRDRLAGAQRAASGGKDEERSFSFACQCGRKYRLGTRHIGRRVKCVCGARNFITVAETGFS